MPELIRNEKETMVPGVGELRPVLQTNKLFIFSGNRTSKIRKTSQCGHVLVQPEMENCRSPLASIPPFSPVGMLTQLNAVAAGETGSS
jgi:hypothetical protein